MGDAAAFVYFLIPIALLTVAGILGLGIFSLAKGGEFAAKHSNRLMRLRVIFQALAIVIIMTFLWLSAQSGA